VKKATRKSVQKVVAMPAQQLNGDGFTATVNGGKLTIEIDLSSDFGPSESGKTSVIARSRFAALPGLENTTWMNLMVCRKMAAEQPAAAAPSKKAVRK
jgi:hypothetical protein